MLKRISTIITLMFAAYISGCASVPMASKEEDQRMKEFAAPPAGNSGLYIYRNTNLGGALKKSVYVDGEFVGETGPMTYFYKQVKPGKHTLSTESEFSNNDLALETESGKNYFIYQYIKMGLLVGGAGLELVEEKEGREGVLECDLAKAGLPEPSP